MSSSLTGLLLWRLTKVSFADDGSIDCEAEPFFYGGNSPHLPAAQGSNPGSINAQVSPGSVGLPYFFEPILRLITDGNAAELWIGIPAKNPNYGGCEIFLSIDAAASYQSIGVLPGKSTLGTVTGSTWPAAADPDTTNDLSVDLTASLGSLASFPASTADAFVSLCVVEGGAGAIPYEIIAYTTAQLAAANKYTLKATGAGNEIRRAVYSAPTVGMGVAHAPGVTTYATPALVQGQEHTSTGAGSNVYTFPSPVTVGNRVIVAMNAFLPPPFTAANIIDNLGNVWKPIISHVRPSYLCMGWYADITAGGTMTITVNCPGANSSSFIRASFNEISGLDPASTFDSAVAGDNLAGSGTWAPGGPVTTSTPNGLIFTFVHNDTTLTAPSGYSAAGSFGSAQAAYKVQATAGTYTPNWTVVGNSGIGFSVAFPADITLDTRTAFIYLHDPIFKAPLDPKWIGKTLYFKFAAFNIFRQAQQNIATLPAYPYTVTGVVSQVSGVAAETYSISPANPLTQPVGLYVVSMAQCTATFSPSGVITNYNTRTFAVADPGVGNVQQYWVTIQDPGHIGDTGIGTTLNAFCDSNQTKWNTAGFIRIGTIVVTHYGGGTGGNGGSSAGPILVPLVITDSGDHVTFTIDRPVTVLLLFRNGDFVDPSDYTFTGSGFVLLRALAPGENLNAVGA